MSIVNALTTLASESIGMTTDIVRGTRNITKAYESGTRILLNHTEYYADVHSNHAATKQAELTKATQALPDDVQAMLAQLKANAQPSGYAFFFFLSTVKGGHDTTQHYTIATLVGFRLVEIVPYRQISEEIYHGYYKENYCK